MGKKRRKPSPSPDTGIEYAEEFAGLVPGDFFRVAGEIGRRFQFSRLARKNGKEWVEAFEIWRGQPERYRAFKPEKVKV